MCQSSTAVTPQNTPRKHNSQVAPLLIKRNPETIDILLGGKGYDDQKIRRLARQ